MKYLQYINIFNKNILNFIGFSLITHYLFISTCSILKLTMINQLNITNIFIKRCKINCLGFVQHILRVKAAKKNAWSLKNTGMVKYRNKIIITIQKKSLKNI